MTPRTNNPRTGDMATVAHAEPLKPGPSTVTMLVLMAGIALFAQSVYTPSLPTIARAFNEDVSAVQITFVIFILGFGVGQLIFGPLTNRFGRRPVLFAGLSLFLVGTLASALSPDLVTLICARALQALGGASTIIVARACARDSFEGVELLRLGGIVIATFALVPGISPLIGSAILEFGGWEACFWVTLCFGTILLAYFYLKLPETARTRMTRLDVQAVWHGFATVVRDRVAMYGIAGTGMTMGTMTAFNAGAPSLYIEHLGVSTAEYGLYPFLSAFCFAAGALVGRRLTARMSPAEIGGRGLVLMVPALALMLLLPAFGLVHKHVFSATLIVYSLGFGMFFPPVNTMIQLRFSENIGFAAAALGFLQICGGAFGAAAVSLVQTGLPILALPLTMLTLIIVVSALSPKFLINDEQTE